MKRNYGILVVASFFLVVCLAATAFAGGLIADGSQMWSDHYAEENDNFGQSVCTGDFNGDGYDDLVGGCPGEDFSEADQAGAVYVIYGSRDGLPSAGAETQYLHQGDLVLGELEERDLFGWCMAAGDFDNDGYDDLAIGVPEENVGDVINAGAVNVVYGSVDGLDTERVQHWIQDSDWIHGSSEAHDYFGYSLAVGNFNRDSYQDLAVGAAREDLGGIEDAGELHIIYGGPSGLGIEVRASQDFDQLVAGVPDTAEEGDWFGYSLAAGSLNNDGYWDDLLIGIPYEDVSFDSSVVTNAGAAMVLYGDGSGLSSDGALFITRATDGPGDPGQNEMMGMCVACGRDSGADPRAMLAIGIPGDDSPPNSDCGGVLILNVGPVGFTFFQPTFEDNSGVGKSFAIGDMDGDEYADILVGVYRYDTDGERDAGKISLGHGADDGHFFFDQRYGMDLDDPGMAGVLDSQSQLGYSTAIGDFNGDGIGDAAVGAPGYDYYGEPGSGGISVIYSTDSPWNRSDSVGDGWRYSDWFGFFSTIDEPWIYHIQHGWMYCFGTHRNRLTFWDPAMGVFWWTSNYSYPYVYRFSDGRWLWYQKGSRDPRWFVNLATGVWEEH